MFANHSPAAGYTLLELLIAVGILVILITLAIPDLGRPTERVGVTTQANEFRAALNRARSEAMQRQTIVYLCRITPDTLCDVSPPAYADWSRGWTLFVDLNENRDFDATDLLLASVRRPETGVKTLMNHRGRLRFFPDGSARSVGFYVCGAAGHVRYISLLRSGRARVSRDLPAGKKRTCPGT